MALRSILKYGHPVLHAPSAPVTNIDGQMVSLVNDMVATMYGAPGIGLAAPQIGVPLRVIVIDLSVGEDKSQLIKLVNPELVGHRAAGPRLLSRDRPPRRPSLRGQAVSAEARPPEAQAAQAREER